VRWFFDLNSPFLFGKNVYTVEVFWIWPINNQGKRKEKSRKVTLVGQRHLRNPYAAASGFMLLSWGCIIIKFLKNLPGLLFITADPMSLLFKWLENTNMLSHQSKKTGPFLYMYLRTNFVVIVPIFYIIGTTPTPPPQYSVYNLYTGTVKWLFPLFQYLFDINKLPIDIWPIGVI
jgi:hypothetical protein